MAVLTDSLLGLVENADARRPRWSRIPGCTLGGDPSARLMVSLPFDALHAVHESKACSVPNVSRTR